jgi:hypothetical protein
MKRIYALDHVGRSKLKSIKRNVHKLGTRSIIFTPDLENGQTHVTLRKNPNLNLTPLLADNQTNNNITPIKVLVTTSPNENNLHTIKTTSFTPPSVIKNVT